MKNFNKILDETPFQTAGPFLHIGCMPNKIKINSLYESDLGEIPFKNKNVDWSGGNVDYEGGVGMFFENKTIDGNTTRFEIVSSDINNGAINEEAPFPGNNFAFLYRDDGQGASSSNSGFFCHFE